MTEIEGIVNNAGDAFTLTTEDDETFNLKTAFGHDASLHQLVGCQIIATGELSGDTLVMHMCVAPKPYCES